MRDNRDILEKLRATIADMEYMEVPGEWLVPVEEARDEIARLRAENERLRAALEEIADQESNHAADIRCNCTPQDMLIEARVIARAALEGK